MRILLITSSYHPYKGGVESVVRDLAHGICSYGDTVVVVTNLWPSSLPLCEVLDGVTVIRVPMVSPCCSAGFVSMCKWFLTDVILSAIMVLFRPSVINVQCVGPNGYWAKRLNERFYVPIVVSTHGERTNDSSGFYLVRQNEENYVALIASAKAVVCVSEVSAIESLTKYGVNSSKLTIIPNGISVVEHPIVVTERTVDITYVGRLVPEKGVDTLIKAVTKVSRRFPNLTVKIVGDGPSYEELKRLVVDSGLTGRVLLVGQLDRQAVTQVLLSSKILVLPSRKESFGLVLLEAANAGCAVVATSTGGIPSIVEHGVNGFLFEVESDSQLAEHLDHLLTDEPRRLELVSKFRSRLPNYDIANFVSQYRTVFADVIKS
jgi:glycogen(starch) synthase